MKVIRRTRKEVIERWVAALRSGEYKQANGVLRSGRNFCCLGVLCDLARKDGGRRWRSDGGEWSYAGEDSFPPEAMREFVFADAKKGGQLFADMNDTGTSFQKIAAEIERTLL